MGALDGAPAPSNRAVSGAAAPTRGTAGTVAAVDVLLPILPDMSRLGATEVVKSRVAGRDAAVAVVDVRVDGCCTAGTAPWDPAARCAAVKGSSSSTVSSAVSGPSRSQVARLFGGTYRSSTSKSTSPNGLATSLKPDGLSDIVNCSVFSEFGLPKCNFCD